MVNSSNSSDKDNKSGDKNSKSIKKDEIVSNKSEKISDDESVKKGFAKLLTELSSDIDESRLNNSRFDTSDFMTLPVVPIREGVLFPSTESVLTFGRKISINALKASIKSRKLVVLVSQKKADTDEPMPEDLYKVGTLAYVEKTLNSDDSINALVRGIGRVSIVEFISSDPRLIARVQKLDDVVDDSSEVKAMASHLQKEFRKAVHMGKPVEFLNFMKLMGGVTDGELADQIASTLSVKTEEKQEILETLSVKDRLAMVIKHLAHEMKVLEIEKDVVHKTQAKFDKHMRDNILRERLKTIQKELGDIEDDEEVVGEYEKTLKKLNISKDLKNKISKEIKRLRQMSPANPEAGYVRTWLDTVFELPWNKTSDSIISLKKSSSILDQNHYGLEEVKDRILEYLAVLQLKQQSAKKAKSDKKQAYMPTILCFVGPPGVGKTSIGRSIAEALNRKFVKVSLGGIRDEAEIRGHRRTYVGAMPGKIINGIKQAGENNPVFMLDEVDKIGADYKGDPSAALLEALDPEQNFNFEDHYLDMPFDLSKVIFIATANTLDTIPSALRDRLEIIRYSGYTREEKFQIAKRHLINKVLESNGLTPKSVKFPSPTLTTIIESYTQEAGVRNLERELSKVARKVARKIIESRASRKKSSSKKTRATTITRPSLKKFLGPAKFDVTITHKTDLVGQATGLAYTAMGGDVLFIEAALTAGKGNIKLTGKLGDVMKESAQAAMTYVKANAKKLKIDEELLTKKDVHVHVPEGAVPKEGPSAGVTMVTAIVSALTNRPVKREVAMTGEITLQGRVLRIGGLKEKSIAAHRAGSKIVLFPKDNERDLVKVPNSVKKDIEFIPCKDIGEVLKKALK